jgi:hypothetical protein
MCDMEGPMMRHCDMKQVLDKAQLGVNNILQWRLAMCCVWPSISAIPFHFNMNNLSNVSKKIYLFKEGNLLALSTKARILCLDSL